MKTIKQINKEFDERFVLNSGINKDIAEDIKYFLKAKIEANDKEIKEKIEKMVKYRDLDKGGYNQALNDVLKVI